MKLAEPDDAQPQQVENTDANVVLSYFQRGLERCVLQARTPAEIDTTLPEDQTWRDILPTFLDRRRSSDPGTLSSQRMASVDSYETFLEDNYPSEAIPIVLEAQIVATELINHIVSSLPEKNRSEVVELIESYGYKYDLVVDLLLAGQDLDQTSIRRALDDIGRDRFLNDELRRNIEEDPEFYIQPKDQLLLVMHHISSQGFQWEGVEVKDADNVDNSRWSTIHEASFDVFGTEIPIADSIYRIEKANDEQFVVRCISDGEQSQWVATIPFKVPVQEIATIAEDPNADFRNIRSLVSASLLAAA